MSSNFKSSFAGKITKLVAAALALVTLAGCAQLPRSSEIMVGPEIKGDIASDYLYYSPSGPSVSESQQDILSGFINAGTGPQNDYQAAREYLAQSFRAKWNPNAEVLIQQGNPSISFNAKQQASVTVQVQASVDADGHYQVMDSGTIRALTFGMVRENGEWRISSAPNLTILIRPVFDVIFRSYSIYFYDQPKQHLVPDLRWFPSRASTATRMVNALLKGPSDWLKPAVSSAIPAGTALSLNSVTVAEGIASVDLTAKALTAKVSARRLMKAQIRATLTQLPNVYSVSISVERGPQEIADLVDMKPTLLNDQAVILQDGQLQVLDVGYNTPIGGTAQFINQVGATDFAITNDHDWVALKAAKGVYRGHLRLFGNSPTLIDGRAGQLVPSFDLNGYLWTMTRTSGDPILVTSLDGIRHTFTASWLDAFPKRQFSISAEGSRLAILVGSGTSVRVFVAGIIRDSTGLPVALGAPIELVRAGTSPISVSWADETTLAVLQSQSAGAVSTNLVTVGGTSREFASLDSARSLEVRNATSTTYAVDSQHSLFEYRNLSWSKIRSNVQSIHFTN